MNWDAGVIAGVIAVAISLTVTVLVAVFVWWGTEPFESVRPGRWREELKAVPTEIPDPRPSPAERLSGREERAEIIRAIRQLPRKQADAALMRFVQELSYQEIAQALGCSEVTVRTHIARARTRLSKLLAHLAPHSPKEAMNG